MDTVTFVEKPLDSTDLDIHAAYNEFQQLRKSSLDSYNKLHPLKIAYETGVQNLDNAKKVESDILQTCDKLYNIYEAAYNAVEDGHLETLATGNLGYLQEAKQAANDAKLKYYQAVTNYNCLKMARECAENDVQCALKAWEDETATSNNLTDLYVLAFDKLRSLRTHA